MTEMPGPISALTGVSGPRASDIGIYTAGVGRGSTSVLAGVFAAMPTMVSQMGL